MEILSPTLVRFFCYDTENGDFFVFNVGPNGVVDSTDNLTRGGDDYGLISLIITAPNIQQSDVGTALPVFADGIAWGAPTVYNGKIQLSGNAVAASFLPVSSDPTVLFTLPAGLQPDDFTGPNGVIEIETGNNDIFNMPGRTLFSAGDPIAGGALFFCIPEPSSIALLGIALLSGFYIRRRR